MWILFPDEILIEPMSLFDLEADSWYRDEFFRGYVDNKPAVQAMSELSSCRVCTRISHLGLLRRTQTERKCQAP